MSTAEQRATHAAYMRVWATRHSERIKRERRERYATDTEWREKKIRIQRLSVLRERGGVDADTEAMLSVLEADPCVFCGVQTVPNERKASDGACVDHIDASGDSNWTNLAACCRSCNATKGKVPLLLSLLERQLRRDLTPLAEQVFLIKGRVGQRRRLDF